VLASPDVAGMATGLRGFCIVFAFSIILKVIMPRRYATSIGVPIANPMVLSSWLANFTMGVRSVPGARVTVMHLAIMRLSRPAFYETG